ncbi:MAG TPA: ABC transporter ATP-binding protein [Cellvibrio sp.]
MDSTAISMQSIQFSWKGNASAGLDIEQLQIARGEKIFLYGPSGSGKTTLLNIVAGVITPTQGKINLLGKDITRLSSRQRDQFRAQHLGIIFQQFNLIPYLNVTENLLLRMAFLSAEKRRLATTQMPLLLERLQLTAVLTTAAYQLSVGQQQRVALVRALLGAPEIIIADEPTSALDSELREEFMRVLFEALGENTSLLLVSHDRQLQPYFDRVLNIQQFVHQPELAPAREVQ